METEKPARKASGGWRYHKPGCICHACKGARKRVEETNALSTRAGGFSLVSKDEVAPISKIGTTYARNRVAQWIAMRAENPSITNGEIAKRLGVSYSALAASLSKAQREGWLKFEDSLERIEFELIPKALDNVSDYLKKGDKDASMSLETLKHTAFKQYQESKVAKETQPVAVLALKIETVDPANIKVISGSIVGIPNAIEGEVEEPSETLP